MMLKQTLSSRLLAIDTIKVFALTLALFQLNACAEFDWNPLDPRFVAPEDKREVPAPELIHYNLSIFKTHNPIFFENKIYDPKPILQRSFNWEPIKKFSPFGKIRLWHSLDKAPAPQAQDPKEIISSLDPFKSKKIQYLNYVETKNSLGPVEWRRVSVGPDICVIFQQNWKEALVTGYFCAGAGKALSSGQAETVIQSIEVKYLTKQ